MSKSKNGRFEEDDAVRWYLNNELHREDGPAIEYFDGAKAWYRNGLYHRSDGPAYEMPGEVATWYLDGIKHREDGPAVMQSDGTKEWWINGIELTEREFDQWLGKRQLNEKLQSSLAPSPSSKKGKI